jgi:aminopeptidase N
MTLSQAEINEIFDDISYSKGGSLIRMMANFLDVDVFNRGIEHYLRDQRDKTFYRRNSKMFVIS